VPPAAQAVLADVEVIETTEVLIDRCASLRAEQRRAGHAPAQKIREADRWVAATAAALSLELVAGDGIFENVAGLDPYRVRR
jgi:predicted nucleic acid-binding protein